MNTSVVWKEGMLIDGQAGAHTVAMDAKAPIGKDLGASPKELVAIGLGGCTAMDVVALLKKHKQPLQSLRVDVDIRTSTGGHPAIFEYSMLTFKVEGEIDPKILLESVQLSQTKFCGVSAMLSKAFPIEYRVILNSREIGQGHANFGSKGPHQ